MPFELVGSGGAAVVVESPPASAPVPNAPAGGGGQTASAEKKACFQWGGQSWGQSYAGWPAFKQYLQAHDTDPDAWIDAHPAAAKCIGASKSTVAYNPYGYVEGGSSSQVGQAVEAQAITTPGTNPVQVPISVEQSIPPTTLVTLPDGSVVPFSQTPAGGGSGTGSSGGGGGGGGGTGTDSGDLTHSQLEQIWVQAGGRKAASDIAAAIAQAESHGDPNAVDNTAYPSKAGYHAPSSNASEEYSIGLWQINIYVHKQWSYDEMLSPVQNALAAVQLSGGGDNFTPWSTYNDGAYKKYLTGSTAAGGGGGSSSSGGGTTSGTPSTPAGVKQGWRNLVGFYASTVPTSHANVVAVGTKIKGVFG